MSTFNFTHLSEWKQKFLTPPGVFQLVLLLPPLSQKQADHFPFSSESYLSTLGFDNTENFLTPL